MPPPKLECDENFHVYSSMYSVLKHYTFLFLSLSLPIYHSLSFPLSLSHFPLFPFVSLCLSVCLSLFFLSFLDLSPNGVLEVGAVFEGDELYQGYSDRFLLKFPAHCQVE